MPQMKFCPHCLSTMPEKSLICPFCGDQMVNLIFNFINIFFDQ